MAGSAAAGTGQIQVATLDVSVVLATVNRALNHALDHARGALLVFIDDDVAPRSRLAACIRPRCGHHQLNPQRDSQRRLDAALEYQFLRGCLHELSRGRAAGPGPS